MIPTISEYSTTPTSGASVVGRDGTALPNATIRSGCAGISKVPLSAVKERVPESSELQPASSRA
ncbi:hypothetical protein ACTXMA_09920, partial [Corynebacterium variabile]|uniref:hypothetical protein n=1 Tax=Corynebacterium variabile TaxID=1727 RepID=UPI003FD1A738